MLAAAGACSGAGDGDEHAATVDRMNIESRLNLNRRLQYAVDRVLLFRPGVI
jgi:hypothetical protein